MNNIDSFSVEAVITDIKVVGSFLAFNDEIWNKSHDLKNQIKAFSSNSFRKNFFVLYYEACSNEKCKGYWCKLLKNNV